MTVEGRPPVSNGGVVTVINGDEVKVNCRAAGSYPPVNKITTTCGGLVNVKDGASEATQTLYVRKEDNNKKCTCKAEHESGCYGDDESEFTLNVRYTPTMTSFEADKKSTELTVSADDDVTFVCEAEGNPVPSVSVKGQRWDGIVTLQNTPSGSYGRKSTGTKKMTCQDTDVYTCTAHNGVGSAGTTRTVTVFVQCVPELPSGSDSSIQEYSPVNGTYMDIQIPIIGYPPPEEFSLKKITNTRRRRRATEKEEVPKHMYNTRYVAGPAPKGTVSLTLIGFTTGHSGQYAFNIGNGIGQGLDYTFNVTVVVAASRPNETTSSELETSTVIGVVIAFVLGVVLTILGFFLWMKARKSRSRGAKNNEHDSSNGQARLGQHQPSPHHSHQESPLDDYDVANAQESQQGASGRNKYWRIVLGGAPGEENAATVTAAISSLPPSNPHNLVSSNGVYEECDIYDEFDSELPVEPTVLLPVNQGVYENNLSPPFTTVGPEGAGGPKPQEYDYDYLLPQSPPSPTAELEIGQPTTLEDCDGYVITHPQSLPPTKLQGTIIIHNGDNASKDSTYNNVGNNNYSNVDISGKARQGVNGEPVPLEHNGGSMDQISPPTARAHSEGLGKPSSPEDNGGHSHPLPLTTPMQSQPTIDIKSGDNTPNASVNKNVGNTNYYNVAIADKG